MCTYIFVLDTYCNEITIAVNPYRWNDQLYSENLRQSYSLGRKDELIPHVYFTANRAYHSMKNTEQDQSILVSGESGAGKTETTKIIMGYIASVAKGGHNNETISKIVDVNPLLEAFGNASTIRNDNSSRFGKFTTLQFCSSGTLIGAECKSYLLEKCRVVSVEKDERNFHLFYQVWHLYFFETPMKNTFKSKRCRCWRVRQSMSFTI